MRRKAGGSLASQAFQGGPNVYAISWRFLPVRMLFAGDSPTVVRETEGRHQPMHSYKAAVSAL